MTTNSSQHQPQQPEHNAAVHTVDVPEPNLELCLIGNQVFVDLDTIRTWLTSYADTITSTVGWPYAAGMRTAADTLAKYRHAVRQPRHHDLGQHQPT